MRAGSILDVTISDIPMEKIIGDIYRNKDTGDTDDDRSTGDIDGASEKDIGGVCPAEEAGKDEEEGGYGS
jgi:hypothetical protein